MTHIIQFLIESLYFYNDFTKSVSVKFKWPVISLISWFEHTKNYIIYIIITLIMLYIVYLYTNVVCSSVFSAITDLPLPTLSELSSLVPCDDME